MCDLTIYGKIAYTYWPSNTRRGVLLIETRKYGTRVLDGKLLKVDRDTVVLDNGREALREVVRHPGGVCIAALDGENNLWFVRQFRYAMGEDVTELPAGKLEWGEDPAEAAARELQEETGCTADRIVKLAEGYPSPGYTTEVLHLFFATGLHAGEQHLDEDERITAFPIPLDTAVSMVMRGELRDSKTQTLVLMVNELLKGRKA